MSDLMTPIPFANLMEWILTEYKTGAVFGVRRPFAPQPGKTLDLFGEKLETPFGPAAGPHTQLTQNIVAAYCGGARFFELKTVQIMDGEELSKCVSKPCIVAEDVVTRGGRVQETIDIVRACGGRVLAVATLVDRSNGAASFGEIPHVSLLKMAPVVYEPSACPLCAQGSKAVHPGS